MAVSLGPTSESPGPTSDSTPERMGAARGLAPALTPELPWALAARRPRVLVVGEAILDGWLDGPARRLAREAPAPVVDVARRSAAPGGAANTAANLAALGADVRLVTVLGDDAAGDELTELLRVAGVDVQGLVVEPGRRTLSKLRVAAGDQVLLRVDDGDTRPPPPEVDAELAARVKAGAHGCAGLLVCDYGAGTLAGRGRQALLDLRPGLPLVVVDAHDPGAWAELEPDLVTPNADEAAGLLGAALPADETGRLVAVERGREALLTAANAGAVVVTLDRHGAALVAAGQPLHRTWADPAPDRATAGAGDTFVAALTLAATAGLPLPLAVELGQVAADVVVHLDGTALCGLAALSERLSGFRSATLTEAELRGRVDRHRAEGRRVVFTNGCFDVLHRGHVAYLNQARSLGDVLVVAVNSDASVARLKGPHRPVNTSEDRVAVLAALSCVDLVTVFDADTPFELIERLRPDVYVKGGDYTPAMLAETEVVRRCGGEVRIVDYLPDHSTSAVINRIRARD